MAGVAPEWVEDVKTLHPGETKYISTKRTHNAVWRQVIRLGWPYTIRKADGGYYIHRKREDK